VEISKTDTPATILSEVRPEIFLDAPLFDAIARFYSPESLIRPDLYDLATLLQWPKLTVYSASGLSHKASIYALLDQFPDIIYTQGSLRFYEASKIDWVACEEAETALGEFLANGTYNFAPDFFTLFSTAESSKSESSKSDSTECKVTIITGE
jgi:hypothetical protein